MISQESRKAESHEGHLEFLASNLLYQPRWMIPESFNFDWVMYQSRWPWLELDLQVPVEKIYQEAMALRDQFRIHRFNDRHHGYRHEGWSSLCVHGLGAQKTESFHAYGFSNEEEAQYHWTEIAIQCPSTVEFIKSLPFERFRRVRFMMLSPGGFIYPHRDQDDFSFYPINIAINHPDGCRFVMEGQGEVPFEPGKAFLMNLAYRHCVFNESEEPRIHMIVHGSPGNRKNDFERLVEKGFLYLKSKQSVRQ